MKMLFLTCAEIAKLALPGLPKTESGMIMRAKREGWTGVPRADRGGGFEYSIDNLPPEALAAFVAQIGMKRVEPDPIYRPTPGDIYRRETLDLADKSRQRTDAKLEILAAFDRFRRDQTNGVVAARIAFAQMFNAKAEIVPSWVYDIVPHVCPNSLITWTTLRSEGKLRSLAGRYGHRKGQGVIERHQALRDLIIGVITQSPGGSTDDIRDLAVARFGERVTIDAKSYDMPSIRGFQRFVERWKSQNKALFSKVTNPDEYRHKYEPAPGEMYGDIVRRNQLWETDASPADVMCLDGRYSIYVMLDVHSRTPRVRITKTPKAEAALLLMRDCILGLRGRAETAWGVPDRLKTDNGSDFKAHHYTDVIRRLGIEQEFCDPYSPKQKAAVERAIGTIQHGFMALRPGFIGHNVTDRKAIEARKSFAARLGQDDKDAFCVELTAAELQAQVNDWIEHVYMHDPHDGLNGKTPFQVRASCRSPIRKIEHEGALDFLLMIPADGRKGVRTVTKKGIQVNKIDYYHEDLMPGEEVSVRLDPDDLGRIYVYRGDPFEFVGFAINPELSGVSRIETAGKVKAAHKQIMREGTAEIRRAQRQVNISTIGQAIVQAAAERNAGVVAFPVASVAHTTPDLEAAAAASKAVSGALPAPDQGLPLTPEEEARADAVMARLAPVEPVVIPLPSSGRPKHFGSDEAKINWMADNPALVTDADIKWLTDLRKITGGATDFNYGDEISRIMAARKISAAG